MRRLWIFLAIALTLACSDSNPKIDGGSTATPLTGSTQPQKVAALPSPARGITVLKDVRSAAQEGWDRIVFEFAADGPETDIAYTSSVSQCGSGAPVTVDGGAILLVRMHAAQAHDDNGRITISNTMIKGPGKAIVEAKQVCDFEGQVGWAVGIRGERPFRASALSNPQRIVIDVKQ